MVKKILVLLGILAISISAAGCTTSQATINDEYGDYLSEMNAGNTDFTVASQHYDNASAHFSKGNYPPAIKEIKAAEKSYDLALEHYQNMTPHAASDDQRGYADALQAYSRSCMYASGAYGEAYIAFQNGDRNRGNARLKDATDYIDQAGKEHSRAASLQPYAIV